MARRTRLSSIQVAIAALPGGPWYRRVDLARELGCSIGAILRLSKSELHPDLHPQAVTLENRRTYLYSRGQLEKYRAHLRREGAGAGRPPIFTPEQAAVRRRLSDRARYFERRVDDLTAAGNHDMAEEAARRAQELRDQLAGAPELQEAAS